MTVKEKILKAVQEMPPDVIFDEVMERLYFVYKIEQGLKEVEAGNTISHQEAKQQLQEGAIKRAKRDLELAQEWFNLEEEK